MSLNSPISQPQKPEVKRMHLFNYTNAAFEFLYLDEQNKPQSVSIPAVSIKTFETPLAELVLTHLATFILHLSGFDYKSDVNKQLEKIKKKIIINA